LLKRVKTAQQNWPAWLWLVRHGESAGNVARDQADRAGAGVIDIADRDADVPLSPLGERQSRALARWFAALPAGDRPNVILTSPYVRAQQTAAIVVEEAGLTGTDIVHAVDERLREKEFGILDRLTRTGSMQRYPEQAQLRARLGKFYHRPPGGESWCDVILRLRSVSDEIQLQHAGQRVLIVAHQVIVLCFRYLLERMTEQQILEIDAAGDVANCAVTSYRLASAASAVASGARDGAQGMTLCLYNHVAPLEQAGAPVTAQSDAPVAPR
jgi:broad specificity phosphatase PhoE